jgi:hypothetical protein
VPFSAGSDTSHDLTVTFAARAAMGLGVRAVSITAGCAAIAARIGYISLRAVVTKVFNSIVGGAVVSVANVCALERRWADPNESDQTVHVVLLRLAIAAEGDARITVLTKPRIEPAAGVPRPYLPITGNRVEIFPAWNGTQFFTHGRGHRVTPDWKMRKQRP